MILNQILNNFVKCRYISAVRCKSNNAFTNKLTMDKLDLKNKRILMRVDFNVPMENGIITNNQKIIQSLKSIKYALEKQPKSIVLMSHLGTPGGRKNPLYSLKPIATELKKLLQSEVTFLSNCVGIEVENVCKNAENSSIILLENLRFHMEEEGYNENVETSIKESNQKKIKAFRTSLAKLADIYINDAFDVVHKAHSSVLGEGYKNRAAGFLLSEKLDYFSKVLHKPSKKFSLMIGGAKLSDKLPLIENMLDKIDNILIFGDMAYTFLKVLSDINIGDTPFDGEDSKIVMDLMLKACQETVEIYLPVDFVCGTKITQDAEVCSATVQSGIPKGYVAVDIGCESRKIYHKIIQKAKMIVWDGVPNCLEIEKFSKGTKAIVDSVVKATERGSVSIIGGNDTVACIAKFETTEKMSHVSSEYGSYTKLLEGKELPGIAALSDI